MLKCDKCDGTGLLYWGHSTRIHCDWYVPCPKCRPNEEQRHPHHKTTKLGDQL
jgi:hypothetical protein